MPGTLQAGTLPFGNFKYDWLKVSESQVTDTLLLLFFAFNNDSYFDINFSVNMQVDFMLTSGA